jgi:hypothetical protein
LTTAEILDLSQDAGLFVLTVEARLDDVARVPRILIVAKILICGSAEEDLVGRLAILHALDICELEPHLLQHVEDFALELGVQDLGAVGGVGGIMFGYARRAHGVGLDGVKGGTVPV